MTPPEMRLMKLALRMIYPNGLPGISTGVKASE